MKIIGLMVTVFTFSTLSFTVAALNYTNDETLVHSIRASIKKSGLPGESLGVVVWKAGIKSKPIYSHKEEKQFIPASLTKIVTASAVLSTFPQDHKFITKLSSPAPVSGTTLKGDLYFVGDGDPGYVSENMWFLVNEFVRSRIQVIQGDIVVDDHKFDQIRFDEGRDPSRVDRAYDSPIGALSFNWNAVNVFVRPGRTLGEPAKVFADPENLYIKVKNHTQTVSGRRNSLKVSRTSKNGKDIVTVSGGIGVNAKEVVKFKSISQPEVWTGYQLRSFLRNRGIEVRGTIRKGRTPRGSTTLASSEGKSIASSVRDMMKFSNNFVAEMLTKNLAARKVREEASMKNGVNIINNHLLNLGLKSEDFYISSPSGLSRKNKFRPIDLMKVLKHLKNNFMLSSDYLSSLPIAGVDGTLKKRMRGTAAAGWVRGKTGTLSGVTGIAGYAGRPSGAVYSFVMVYNGRSGGVEKANSLFDQIAAQLVRGK